MCVYIIHINVHTFNWQTKTNEMVLVSFIFYTNRTGSEKYVALLGHSNKLLCTNNKNVRT